jgi:hypothetical protein
MLGLHLHPDSKTFSPRSIYHMVWHHTPKTMPEIYLNHQLKVPKLPYRRSHSTHRAFLP